MDVETMQIWLVGKFKEIERRWLAAVEQLNEEQLNWRPNEGSNSIANLVVHIRGNVSERISAGINGEDSQRDRDAEFESVGLGKAELIELVREAFGLVIRVVEHMTPQQFAGTQTIRGRQRTNFDVLLQCATHFSEHLGQVLYVAKQRLDEKYVTTTIPKRHK
jgi:uncharacterized damage-inducible protein DinB